MLLFASCERIRSNVFKHVVNAIDKENPVKFFKNVKFNVSHFLKVLQHFAWNRVIRPDLDPAKSSGSLKNK
jgi:hypothetical protein